MSERSVEWAIIGLIHGPERKNPKPNGQIMTVITRHLCYQRRHWKGTSLSRLRNYAYCRIDIPKAQLHYRIHEYVGDIPVPKSSSAEVALEMLRQMDRDGEISDKDPIEKRLEVLASLFAFTDPQTSDGFRQQLDIVRKFKKAPR